MFLFNNYPDLNDFSFLANNFFFWHFLITAYAVGSIPFGLWIGILFYKTDVRLHGSENIGATNVVRVLGKVPGGITFLLDSSKGALIATLGWWWFDGSVITALLGGVIAVLGHTRSIFLHFQGGKGVATFFGVLLVLDLRLFGAAVAGWLLAFLATRTSGIAAIATLLILPVTIFQINGLSLVFGVLGLTCAYIIILHYRNINQLFSKINV
ncbi:MAG: glycerol-3-phosphate acyltransferase [SAR324 cluster bacterium]|nr:glycerol-3-phosphate acyltransferase [SAR324 cluster bacterium]